VVFEQWMNSPGHKANMLHPSFTHVGIGGFISPSSTYYAYWTQLFIGDPNGDPDAHDWLEPDEVQ
jgi:uncharacterized protein YkwD